MSLMSITLVSIFSSMYFIVLGLIVKSLIHLSLFFVYGVRWQSSYMVFVF